MTELLPYGVFFAIVAMAATTMFTRFAGYWMMGRLTLTPRVLRMLNALPGSVVTALVLPVALKEGVPAVTAMVAVVLLTIWLRNAFLALACGVAIAAGSRALGL